MHDVLVVGCGLIGTSIGLALRGTGRTVALHDALPANVDVARARGAGEAWDGVARAKLVVVAVPPALTAGVLTELQRRNVGRTYTHVASVQSHVQAEIEALSPDVSVVVGGHPLAGREVSGPGAALQDLFVGRPWAVCAAPGTRPEARAAVEELAMDCGATPITVDGVKHDAAVAVLSHLPQVVSSGLASLLASPSAAIDDTALPLAGPGLADTTRLAAADARLWTEILSLNAAQVLPPLRLLVSQLADVAEALERLSAGPDEMASRSITGMLARGNVGRALVPVKRGAKSEAFAALRVELADAPGELARLLTTVGELGVNVEDVRVEHIPGRPSGVIELLVAGTAVADLSGDLRARSWVVLLS